MKKSKITFEITLDENKVPEKIKWSAPDGGVNNEDSKSTFISVWNHEKQETLKIDLWTKDMPVDQMNVFIHQTLVSMSETFLKLHRMKKYTMLLNSFVIIFLKN